MKIEDHIKELIKRYEETPESLKNPYHEGRYNLLKSLYEDILIGRIK